MIINTTIIFLRDTGLSAGTERGGESSLNRVFIMSLSKQDLEEITNQLYTELYKQDTWGKKCCHNAYSQKDPKHFMIILILLRSSSPAHVKVPILFRYSLPRRKYQRRRHISSLVRVQFYIQPTPSIAIVKQRKEPSCDGSFHYRSLFCPVRWSFPSSDHF